MVGPSMWILSVDERHCLASRRRQGAGHVIRRVEMSYGYSNDLDVKKDFDIDVDIDVDVKFEYDLKVDVDFDVKVNPYVEGNTSTINFDVQAKGDDTFTDVSFALFSTDHLSSTTGSGVAIVG
jgi:hypothetical protein